MKLKPKKNKKGREREIRAAGNVQKLTTSSQFHRSKVWVGLAVVSVWSFTRTNSIVNWDELLSEGSEEESTSKLI